MSRRVYNYFRNLDYTEYLKYFGKFNNLIYCSILSCPEINMKLMSGSIVVADLGAGICGFILEMKKLLGNNISILAFDFSESLLKFGKARIGDIDTILADILKLPVKNNTIDLVFLINVTPYLEEYELNELAFEISRAIKKNGMVVVFHPLNENYIFWEENFGDVILYFHPISLIMDMFTKHFKVIKKKKIGIHLANKFNIYIGWLLLFRGL